MRKFALALLCCGCVGIGLFAQASTGKHGNSKSAPAEAPKNSPDLIEKLGLPRRFVGGIIDKKTQSVLMVFTGAWAPAPEIQGGSSKIAYSSKGAVLQEFLNPSSEKVYRFGFNIGQKEGATILRTFTWPQRDAFDQKKPTAPQEDEGALLSANGRYSVELETFKIVFQAIPKDRWEPTSARLYRWAGTDVQTNLRPLHPSGGDDIVMASQHVPAWAVGSYLVLSDGFMEKAYFRLFGGAITYVIPGVRVDADRPNLGAVFHCDGGNVELGGSEELAELWDCGLKLSGTSSDSHQSFHFRGDWNLETVSTIGTMDSSSHSTTSAITGEAKQVELPPAFLSEVLDRSKEDGWSLSAGPYSLRRILLRAFAGCKLVAPVPAICLTPSTSVPGQLTARAQIFNNGIDAWKSASGAWVSDAEAAGAQYESRKPGVMAQKDKFTAFGKLIPPEKGTAQ